MMRLTYIQRLELYIYIHIENDQEDVLYTDQIIKPWAENRENNSSAWGVSVFSLNRFTPENIENSVH